MFFLWLEEQEKALMAMFTFLVVSGTYSFAYPTFCIGQTLGRLEWGSPIRVHDLRRRVLHVICSTGPLKQVIVIFDINAHSCVKVHGTLREFAPLCLLLSQ